MTSPLLISATERRARSLTPAEQAAIASCADFWRLADAGYLSYRRTGLHSHEIVGHRFVGRARLGDLEFEIREKVEGTLLSLVTAITGADLRIEAAESPGSALDAVSRHLLREFTRAAGTYVANRRLPRYDYVDATGPVLGGTLDMPRTMRRHATGHLGTFAFRHGTVVRDEPLDRLVLAGLDELDRAALALRIDATTLFDARWLAGALAEVRDEAFVSTHLDRFLEVAAALESAPTTSREDVDLCRLATVALLHRGFALRGEGSNDVPRAWFVNLETLFEEAVRQTLGELLPTEIVDRGASYERRMFIGGQARGRTNPDLVIHHQGSVQAVGDVKYKARRGSGPGSDDGRGLAGRSDLYQVLIHAASLHADHAFLVYAADEAYRSHYLGISVTDTRTWAVEVRPTHLRDDLRRFLREFDWS